MTTHFTHNPNTVVDDLCWCGHTRISHSLMRGCCTPEHRFGECMPLSYVRMKNAFVDSGPNLG